MRKPRPHHLNSTAIAIMVASVLPAITFANNPPQETFINSVSTVIQQENQQITEQRNILLSDFLTHQSHHNLSTHQQHWLQTLAKAYDLPSFSPNQTSSWTALIKRVDIIPPSLGVAQAAIESNWGRSRFARQGNNLFGIWCYQSGCGIVPLQRPKNKTYEVKSYPSTKDSIIDYMHTINTAPAYAELRNARYTDYLKGRSIQGKEMAAYLTRYSTKGQTYVQSLQSTIAHHQLNKLDPQHPSS